MENWIAFLTRYKDDHGLNQEDLAERLSMTQGGVGHWLRGTRRPTVKNINVALAKLGLSHLEAQVLVVPKLVVNEAGAPYESDSYVSFRFPVIGWKDLQGPLPEKCTVHLQTDYPARGKAYWLPVENDAMNAASGRSVPEGMLVLVDTQLEAAVGKLVIARQPGKPAVFRQLIEEGGERMLKPLNTLYPTVLCEEGCEFLGVVVRAYSKFP